MIEGNGSPAFPFDLENDLHSLFHPSPLHLSLMNDQLLHGFDSILHLYGEFLMKDDPSIPYLTPCFPIEGCLLCNHFDLVPFYGERILFIAFDQLKNLRFGLKLSISQEDRLHPLVCKLPVDLFCLSLADPLTCLFTFMLLLLHLDTQPCFIKTHP